MQDPVFVKDSHIGGRSENQDTMAMTNTPYGWMFLVCDGMGGGPAGKTASRIAAESIIDYVLHREDDVPVEQVLTESVEVAHQAIKREGIADPRLAGMGTTLALLLLAPDYAVIINVGDSRVYQFRGKSQVFRTTDHSLMAKKIASGEIRNEDDALHAPGSNVITQALGIRDVRPSVELRAYEKGDRFMLCSDGIWGMHPRKELRSMATGKDIRGALDALVISTDEKGRLEGGHHDNLTVILVETRNSSKLKEKMSLKTKILTGLLSVGLLVSIIFIIVLGVRYHVAEEKIKVLENMVATLKDNFRKAEQTSEKAAQVTVLPVAGGSQDLKEEEETNDGETAYRMEEEIVVHEVKRGDNLASIARKYGTSVKRIQELNGLKSSSLRIGQKLKIEKKP